MRSRSSGIMNGWCLCEPDQLVGCRNDLRVTMDGRTLVWLEKAPLGIQKRLTEFSLYIT